MSKVLGTKVEDQLYNLFNSLPGSISENLRKAAIMYYNSFHNKRLTTVNHVVECKTHDDIVSWLDSIPNVNTNDSRGF